MKIIKKIWEKEQKLIIVFLAFLIIVSSYQFVYRSFNKKTKAFATENALLTDTLAELKRKSNAKDQYSEGIKDMTNQIEEIKKAYPKQITQEKITQFVIELEEVAGMQVSSITFQDAAYLSEYPSPSITDIEETSLGADEEMLDYLDEEIDLVDQEESELNNTEARGQTADYENVKPNIYTTEITISYMTTYEGLKQAIDYINEYDDHRNIIDLSAAFDSSTGNLTGTMTIGMYTLYPWGSEYVKPEFKHSIGNENIFGSFELPVE